MTEHQPARDPSTAKWMWLVLASLGVAYLMMPRGTVLESGGAAPAITAAAWFNAGEAFDPGQLRGQVVVLEFWATWCAPCLQSIPHLNELNAHYASDNVVVIGLTDEQASTVEPFIRTRGIRYIVGTGSRVDRDYGVQYLPTAFVIDRTGIIVWSGHPHDGLEQAVAEAVSQS